MVRRQIWVLNYYNCPFFVLNENCFAFSLLTSVCDHSNSTVPSQPPSFGLNEVGTTVEGVSALGLCTVRPISSKQWSFQHGDAFTCIGGDKPNNQQHKRSSSASRKLEYRWSLQWCLVTLTEAWWSPVSMLSLTRHSPASRATSQGRTRPSCGIIRQSPGTRSSELTRSTEETHHIWLSWTAEINGFFLLLSKKKKERKKKLHYTIQIPQPRDTMFNQIHPPTHLISQEKNMRW